LNLASRGERQRCLFESTRNASRIKAFRPRASRLLGEFLLADDPKETKKSDARDLAGLRPDTPLLSRNEMVSLKLTRDASTPGLLGLRPNRPSVPGCASLRQASPKTFVPSSATRRASRAKEEPKSKQLGTRAGGHAQGLRCCAKTPSRSDLHCFARCSAAQAKQSAVKGLPSALDARRSRAGRNGVFVGMPV